MTAAPSPEVRFAIRPMRSEDEDFVCANFLNSYRWSDHAQGIPNSEFYGHFRAEWATVLQRGSVLIAHPEGDEDEIAGFLTFIRRPMDVVVCWAYTKKIPWRGCGVARLLLESAGVRPGRGAWALYASSWALSRFRASGYLFSMLPHTEAVRLLLGAAT